MILLQRTLRTAVLVGFATVVSACTEHDSALSASSSASLGSSPRVEAPAGAVEGLMEGSVRVFKGIPYAVPPVGERRWTPPQALPSWSGVRQATAFGPACQQPPSVPGSVYSHDIAPFSEDCLTLNVWAPDDATNAPVFVWIHGGAMLRGSSKEAMYDGRRLAEHGLVVVSINYRLGVFGYFAHPGLSAESPDGVSGNYGVLDQIEALRWINRNISAFGGDPRNVTIAGESSGALSVMYLMIAPDARDLFSKAIAQSAYMVTMPELEKARYGQPSAEAVGTYIGRTLEADDIDALRAVDGDALARAAAADNFFPLGIVDGAVLPGQMVDIFDRGEQAPVPILTGFNTGEIRSLAVLAPKPPGTAKEYEAIIRERYLDLADEFLRLYPASDMQESIYATTRDALYGWTSQRLVKRQTTLGQPAFLYLFDHGYPAADEAGLHAFHASELPYVFGTFDATPPPWPKVPDTAREARLSEAMLDYWSSFARDATPRAANAPDWPVYGTSKSYMYFGDAPEPAGNMFPGMYELHETAVCRRKASDAAPWHWNTGLISPVLARQGDSCP